MDAQQCYEAIVSELCQQNGVESGKMMSRQAMTCQGKVFAFLSEDGMVFKLGSGFDAQGAGLDDVSVPHPVHSRPPMKNWLRVEQAHQERWTELASLALDTMRGAHASP